MASQAQTAARHLLSGLASLFARAGELLDPERLAGPVLGKELRVSSRRRRNYVLRFLYLAALTLYVVLIWLASVHESGYGPSGSGAYRISMMSRAGQTVILSIVAFQFAAMQLIAIVMLSTSISEEIYHKTLGVLMTTPVGSFKIVLGKLLSRLLQIVILLAISLPLLAIVRVLGGVPWDFILAGVCLTLSSTILVASVTMLFSILSRRAYAVILWTLMALGVVYILLPALMGWALHHAGSRRGFEAVLEILHPHVAFAILAENTMAPRRAGGASFWPWSCLATLAQAALVLMLCTKLVRKAALRQANGERGLFARRRRHASVAHARAIAGDSETDGLRGSIRRISGCPIIWKELRTPMVRSRFWQVLMVLGVIGVVAISYAICFSEDALYDRDTHITYGVIFVSLGILVTAVFSATTITTEKESRSWPILLLTPLSDWRIVLGKAAGILRRCLPAWGLLFGHVILFILLGAIRPVALLHLAMLVIWLLAFFTGSGLYFGSLFRRTTTAVILNLALALVIWGMLTFIFYIAPEITHGNQDFADGYSSGNPLVQAVVTLEANSGRPGPYYPYDQGFHYRYDWPHGRNDLEATNAIMSAWMAGYILVGLVFAVLAKTRLRRHIF